MEVNVAFDQEALDELAVLDAEINKFMEARKALALEKGSEICLQLVKELFQFPGVVTVGWKQYTPYFNDGEPCEFGVHEVMIGINPNDDTDLMDPWHIEYHIRGTWGSKPAYWNMTQWNDNVQKRENTKAMLEAAGWTQTLVDQLHKTLKEINGIFFKYQDFLEDSFGDHVRVVIKLGDEVIAEPYEEHD